MTAEEVFCELIDKYGDDFNWHMLPLSNQTFTAELKKEIGNRHFLYHKQIWAVAKCDSNDDVLYLADNSGGTDISKRRDVDARDGIDLSSFHENPPFWN